MPYAERKKMKIPNSTRVDGKTILKKLKNFDLKDTYLILCKNKVKNSPTSVSLIIYHCNFFTNCKKA